MKMRPLLIGLEAPENNHFKLSIHLTVELNISSLGRSRDIFFLVSMLRCTFTFCDLFRKRYVLTVAPEQGGLGGLKPLQNLGPY